MRTQIESWRREERGLMVTAGWHANDGISGSGVVFLVSCWHDWTDHVCPWFKRAEESVKYLIKLAWWKASLHTPRTKSTSIRSGLTCPVFFGLFLKPCRGRQRGAELDTLLLLLLWTHLLRLQQQLNYRRVSCTLCLHKNTQMFEEAHRAFRLTQLLALLHGNVQLLALQLSLFSPIWKKGQPKCPVFDC